MRPLLLALSLVIAAVSVRASDTLNQIISNPSVQFALILNLKNPQVRQQINAEIAKHPGSKARVDRCARAITHIAGILIEEDGAQIGFLVAVGKFDAKMLQSFQAEGIPAELMDNESVCLGITVNGQALNAEQMKALAESMKGE